MRRSVGSPPLRAPTHVGEASAFSMRRNPEKARRYGLRRMLADASGRTRIGNFSIVSPRKLPPLRAPTQISDASACVGQYTEHSEKSPPLRAPTQVFDASASTLSNFPPENNN